MIAPAAVDARAAIWIRVVVLTPKLKYEGFPKLIDVCRCQWGKCGHCSAGRHEECAHRDGRARGRGHGPETYLISSRHQAALLPVYVKGARGCEWVCSCEPCALIPRSIAPGLPVVAPRHYKGTVETTLF